ncbi:hypothetical protein ACN28S_59935 [Cystobacter fuscus]
MQLAPGEPVRGGGQPLHAPSEHQVHDEADQTHQHRDHQTGARRPPLGVLLARELLGRQVLPQEEQAHARALGADLEGDGVVGHHLPPVLAQVHVAGHVLEHGGEVSGVLGRVELGPGVPQGQSDLRGPDGGQHPLLLVEQQPLPQGGVAAQGGELLARRVDLPVLQQVLEHAVQVRHPQGHLRDGLFLRLQVALRHVRLEGVEEEAHRGDEDDERDEPAHRQEAVPEGGGPAQGTHGRTRIRTVEGLSGTRVHADNSNSMAAAHPTLCMSSSPVHASLRGWVALKGSS